MMELQKENIVLDQLSSVIISPMIKGIMDKGSRILFKDKPMHQLNREAAAIIPAFSKHAKKIVFRLDRRIYFRTGIRNPREAGIRISDSRKYLSSIPFSDMTIYLSYDV